MFNNYFEPKYFNPGYFGGEAGVTLGYLVSGAGWDVKRRSTLLQVLGRSTAFHAQGRRAGYDITGRSVMYLADDRGTTYNPRDHD